MATARAADKDFPEQPSVCGRRRDPFPANGNAAAAAPGPINDSHDELMMRSCALSGLRSGADADADADADAILLLHVTL